MSKVAIVIPTMDNRPYVEPCLYSLLNSTTGVQFRVFIVNNGEADSCDWARRYNVSVINGKGNKGWEGALEMGIVASDEPLILFLNDDTLFLPRREDWLARLVADLDSPLVGAAGPSSNYVSGPQSISYPAPPIRLVARYLIGFCMLVRRSALQRAGGITLDSGADDIDLSIRLRRAGYTLICDRTTFVYHYGAKTGERVYGSVFGPGGWYSREKMEAARMWLIATHGQEAIEDVWSVQPLQEYHTPFSATV